MWTVEACRWPQLQWGIRLVALMYGNALPTAHDLPLATRTSGDLI